MYLGPSVDSLSSAKFMALDLWVLNMIVYFVPQNNDFGSYLRMSITFWESESPMEKFQPTMGANNPKNVCIEEGKMNSFAFSVTSSQLSWFSATKDPCKMEFLPYGESEIV